MSRCLARSESFTTSRSMLGPCRADSSACVPGRSSSRGAGAELASVTGHEIAHVAGRHSTRQISRALPVNTTAEAPLRACGGNNTTTAVVLVAARVALPLTFLKFSRTFEKKADFLGMQYLYKTGYHPLGMVSFFERLSARERSSGGSVTAIFRTHPLSSKCVALVQRAINESLPERSAYETRTASSNACKRAPPGSSARAIRATQASYDTRRCARAGSVAAPALLFARRRTKLAR